MARNRQRNRSARPRAAGSQRPAPTPGDGAALAGPPPIEEDLSDVLATEDEDLGTEAFGAGGAGGRVGIEAAALGEPEPRPGRAAVPPEALERPTRGNIFERTVGFMRASWAELQRVQWPDRPQVVQATGVVLGFVILTGVYLGVCDLVAGKLVNWIV